MSVFLSRETDRQKKNKEREREMVRNGEEGRERERQPESVC